MVTKRLFVFGTHIGYSISPAICGAALRAMGLDWDYSIWDMPLGDLPAAVTYLRRDECLGANVTIPHKEAIVRWLDDLSETARLFQAANTVVKRGDRLAGENTDGIGFMQALADAGLDPRGANIVILGAGGAARAVAFTLSDAGAGSITLVNRTPERAIALARELQARSPQLMTAVGLAEAPGRADLVVNSLPPDVPLDLLALRPADGYLAFDLTYRPQVTPFLAAAGQTGARVMNGVAMLVYQGAASLRLWTGREPDIQAMFAAAHKALRQSPERDA